MRERRERFTSASRLGSVEAPSFADWSSAPSRLGFHQVLCEHAGLCSQVSHADAEIFVLRHGHRDVLRRSHGASFSRRVC